jgi:hypothetical protein
VNLNVTNKQQVSYHTFLFSPYASGFTYLVPDRGIQKLTKKLGEAEIDSVDPLICAWDTHMRMGHRATKATNGDAGDDGNDGNDEDD